MRGLRRLGAANRHRVAARLHAALPLCVDGAEITGRKREVDALRFSGSKMHALETPERRMPMRSGCRQIELRYFVAGDLSVVAHTPLRRESLACGKRGPLQLQVGI